MDVLLSLRLLETYWKVLPQQHISLNKVFFIWRSSGEQLKLQRSIILLNVLLWWSMLFSTGKIRSSKIQGYLLGLKLPLIDHFGRRAAWRLFIWFLRLETLTQLFSSVFVYHEGLCPWFNKGNPPEAALWKMK